MKYLLYTFLIALFLNSCASSKNYLERSDEDKALLDAIKKLNKSATDENASSAIPVLYSNIKASRLAKINTLKTEKDLSRWDKIIKEYQYLQDAYDAIVNSPAAFKLVNAESYNSQLYESRQNAAEEYYNAGLVFLEKTGRENAKKAYTHFNKSDKFIPGFKDAQQKSNDAYNKAVVDVIINPVQDNSFFSNNTWGNTGYNYVNDYFQQTLVRELNGINKERYPARFYSDWQANRENIQPDWIVDMKIRNIDIPYPSNYNYNRNASNQVQIGTDTSGNPVYKTVTALVRITRSSFTARADMEVNISDVTTGKNISYRNFREDYRWQQESATYSGDSRALSAQDWELINNAGFYGQPRKEDILNELFKKLYPQVKNNISYAVDW